MGRKLSLILAGGGIRSISYLGFMTALEKNGIKIDAIGGISGGALAAVIYGLGIDYETIRETFNNDLTIWKLFEKKFLTRRSLISEKIIGQRIRQLVGDATFEDLKIKLSIFATNLTDRKLVSFTKGTLYNPIRATIALAPIIPIAKFNDKEYVDGRLLSIYPTKIMRTKTNTPILGLITKSASGPSAIPFVKRVRYLDLLLENYYKLLEASDEPDMKIVTVREQKGNMFSFKYMDHYYEEGYKSGNKSIDKILQMLDKKR